MSMYYYPNQYHHRGHSHHTLLPSKQLPTSLPERCHYLHHCHSHQHYKDTTHHHHALPSQTRSNIGDELFLKKCSRSFRFYSRDGLRFATRDKFLALRRTLDLFSSLVRCVTLFKQQANSVTELGATGKTRSVR